jgi:hypothetical protein
MDHEICEAQTLVEVDQLSHSTQYPGDLYPRLSKEYIATLSTIGLLYRSR